MHVRGIFPDHGARSVWSAGDLRRSTFFRRSCARLHTNELESVPDTQAVRGYYTSIGVVFGTECGQPNVYTQQALQAYLSEDARALQKIPLDASRHAKILGDVPRLSQDPTAITRAGLRLREGEDVS